MNQYSDSIVSVLSSTATAAGMESDMTVFLRTQVQHSSGWAEVTRRLVDSMSLQDFICTAGKERDSFPIVKTTLVISDEILLLIKLISADGHSNTLL